mmetsp:Transcript_13914/g.35060  ORF Transcript_13914/g.35060 Transcript_13914/m.35060 type:complete len:444 (-) Transcript_13914:13-1344(-)
MQRFHSFGLLLAGLFVGGKLGVTPPLLLRLLVRLLQQSHDQILDHLLHLLERVVSHAKCQSRQNPAVKLGALLVQERCHPNLIGTSAVGTQLHQRGSLLHQTREVLVSGTRDSPGGDNLDGLLNCLDLLRSQRLTSLKVVGLRLACRGQIIQICLIIVTAGHGVLEIALGICLPLRRLGLLLRFVAAVILRCADAVGEILGQHLKRVLGVRLLLLGFCALVLKLIVQLLQDLDDPTCVVLVGGSFRSRHAVSLRRGQERLQLASVGLRHAGDLQQGGTCFLVEHLLLDQRNGAGSGVDRLRQVLVRRQVILVLHLSHLGSGLQIPLVHTDVLVQLSDFLGQLGDVSLAFPNHSLQAVDLLVVLLDRASLLSGGVIAPSLVCSELHLLLVLLFLTLLQHPVHQLNHLLNRRDCFCLHQGEHAAENDQLHGAVSDVRNPTPASQR